MENTSTPELLITTSEAELEPYGDDWDDLVEHVLERNVFYERWMLLPALHHLKEDQEIYVALVWSQADAAESSRVLIGLFPFVRSVGYRRLPIALP